MCLALKDFPGMPLDEAVVMNVIKFFGKHFIWIMAVFHLASKYHPGPPHKSDMRMKPIPRKCDRIVKVQSKTEFLILAQIFHPL